ncbi:MAG: alpha/beta hydrolase [Actinomycetota bacterium]|nr:alpha/beta hydrolase [Actinomycetota bacterium]
MAYAANGHDGVRIYFEDEGGAGVPVLLHDGFGDSVQDLRESELARALPAAGSRLIYVDHRGHGRSDKPHDPAAYAMPLRVADAIAVLDRLGIERAHFIGRSWGGRLCFGIGEHAPERVRSLVIGGNQPYAWPDGPLTRLVGEALAAGCEQGSMEPLVQAFEQFWQVGFPAPQRARLLDNDPLALDAAWRAAMAEGAISDGLERWQVPCLIFIGATDADFLDEARRAAEDIPHAELLLLEDADHYAAHMSQDEVLLEAVLRTLRTAADPAG